MLFAGFLNKPFTEQIIYTSGYVGVNEHMFSMVPIKENAKNAKKI